MSRVRIQVYTTEFIMASNSIAVQLTNLFFGKINTRLNSKLRLEVTNEIIDETIGAL